MRKIFLVLAFCTSLSFAHKLNIFIIYEADELIVNSYFANGKPCKNCKIKIESIDGKLIEESTTDKKGEYYKKISLEEFEVSVDAGGGHITKEIVKSNEESLEEQNNKTKFINTKIDSLLLENKKLKAKIKALEKQLDIMEFFKIFFGLFIIILIFVFLKRIKK